MSVVRTFTSRVTVPTDPKAPVAVSVDQHRRVLTLEATSADSVEAAEAAIDSLLRAALDSLDSLRP